MWKREGYCQGGVSSTPGAGGRGSPGSRSHISGRERPALPPCSLKLASPPRPPGSACRLLLPDASLDHVPACPLPHSRLPPAPFSPLYSLVSPRGDQGSSVSPPWRSEVRGRPHTSPASPPALPAAAKEPGLGPGGDIKTRGSGKGRQDRRAAAARDSPSQALCAPGSRRARGRDHHPPPGRAVPAEILSRADRTPVQGHGIARGGGALREPQGKQTAPFTPFRSGRGAAAEAGRSGPPRRKAGSAEPLNVGGGSERRRGEPREPGSERSLAGGGEGPPASSFLPCLQLTLHQGRRRRSPLKVSIEKARSEPPIPTAVAFCTSNNNELTAALFIC